MNPFTSIGWWIGMSVGVAVAAVIVSLIPFNGLMPKFGAGLILGFTLTQFGGSAGQMIEEACRKPKEG